MLEGREWFRKPGASREDLDRLQSAIPLILPSGLYDLLSYSNGGEGPMLRWPKNFCLYTVDDIIDSFERYNKADAGYPGFVFFGTSGGGDWIAFDTRHGPPFWIVFTDMIAPQREAFFTAPDFDAFLETLGYDSEEDQEDLMYLVDARTRALED